MASATGQPAPPWEGDAKPPWRPRVSGIAGLLCGPVAGALIAFINLRRLKERRKAAWTLALTLLGCVTLGVVIAEAPDNASAILAKLIGSGVSPFLYPWLQKHAFEEWETSNPGVMYDNGWRSSGWAILGLAAFFLIAIGSGLAFSWHQEVGDIEVRYGMPEKVKVGETFVFTIAVQNMADHPQLLHSLDVNTHFLEGISIQGTSPPFEESETNLIGHIRSYTFRQNIPPKGVVEIKLQGHAQKPGSFPLRLDVCVKTAFKCSSVELDTITVQ